MDKNSVRTLAAIAILLVMYILVSLLVPFLKSTVFWISFVFTLAAFLVMAASVYMVLIKKQDARSRFLRLPIARVGVLYCGAQALLSLVLMGIGRWVPVWLACLLYALGLGAALLGLIGTETVADNVLKQDAKQKVDTTFLTALRAEAAVMAGNSDIPEVRQFAEALRYSDPVSAPQLSEIEQQLAAVTAQLRGALDAGDPTAAQLAAKANRLLQERNTLCKLSKRDR